MPEVRITAYKTTDDLLKAMKGDKSVKPISEEVISGGKKDEEASA